MSSCADGQYQWDRGGGAEAGGSHLYDIAPDDPLFSILRGREQPVLKFLPVKLNRHVEPLKVLCEQRQHDINILSPHLPHALHLAVVRQRVPPHLVLRLAVGRQRAEANLIELHPVQRAVVVAAGADGGGEHGAAGVQALPDAVEVAAPGDLLNEHRRQPLVPQLLVHHEEVDLRDGHDGLADPEAHGDGGDEGHQPPRLGGPDSDVVFLLPAGSLEGPAHQSVSDLPDLKH